MPLPIKAVLPQLLTALATKGAAVLIAPPGAGKTTAIAPVLISEEWCDGLVLILSPRRVAARAAAERMAQMLGEKPGETVGYLTRLDSRQSGATRILVMTEAVFVNRILDDAELPGVSAVLFDEAHERHLDSDLGLALALESRAVLRDDLRICVMSATIDGQRFARLLGDDTPVIESKGVAHPLRIEWLPARGDLSLEDNMAQAILNAWKAETGDILAFLPGVRDIARVQDRLAAALPHTPVLPLHGQVLPRDQRAAVRHDPEGRRRVVLATSIAETSLTLEGVSVVVDSGLSRRAQFDRVAGTTHLVTHRASQAASAQRAGRAARQGPGVAYRLWAQAAHAGRPEFAAPEMAIADLAPLVLALARWGTANPADMAWLDPPPPASIDAAQHKLRKLAALDDAGAITPSGRDIARFGMDPAMAAALLLGAGSGQALPVAKLVLLLQERGLGGRSEDIHQRVASWEADRSPRAEASRKLARRWADRADGLVQPRAPKMPDAALFLAQALPDNIAKRRDGSGQYWLAAGGRGYYLDAASHLTGAEWLIVADAQGHAKGARITAAAELTIGDIEQFLDGLITRHRTVRWNAQDERAEARLERRMGAITLSSGPDPHPDAVQIRDVLLEAAQAKLPRLLPADLIARAHYAGIPALDPERLATDIRLWLEPLLDGRRDLEIAPSRIADALQGLLDWNDRRLLDDAAPRRFTSPAGTSHPIDYEGDGAPSVQLRVQAVFGLDRHPMVGTEPLLLQLTSPAGRPIQATRDLPGFWRGSWRDVAKEMKGRYPKHRWPDEPWTEKPSLKTRNALKRSSR